MPISKTIDELNEFLQGEYMGIHAYELYIKQAKDKHVKRELQFIQQDHKLHAIRIAERIQNLGGMAVDDVGVRGHIGEWMLHLKGVPETPKDIIKGALQGEKMGIAKLKKMTEGDLDGDSLRFVEDLLQEDHRHILKLNALLH